MGIDVVRLYNGPRGINPVASLARAEVVFDPATGIAQPPDRPDVARFTVTLPDPEAGKSLPLSLTALISATPFGEEATPREQLEMTGPSIGRATEVVTKPGPQVIDVRLPAELKKGGDAHALLLAVYPSID